MHADGGGLYLQVTKTVSGQLNKSWLYRYAVRGRERQMGLGSLTEVKLADARQKAAECRQQRLDGIDPIEARESDRRLAETSGIAFRHREIYPADIVIDIARHSAHPNKHPNIRPTRAS